MTDEPRPQLRHEDLRPGMTVMVTTDEGAELPAMVIDVDRPDAPQLLRGWGTMTAVPWPPAGCINALVFEPDQYGRWIGRLLPGLTPGYQGQPGCWWTP